MFRKVGKSRMSSDHDGSFRFFSHKLIEFDPMFFQIDVDFLLYVKIVEVNLL